MATRPAIPFGTVITSLKTAAIFLVRRLRPEAGHFRFSLPPKSSSKALGKPVQYIGRGVVSFPSPLRVRGGPLL